MQEIIDRSEYLALSPEEQKNWVLITPTAEDKELAVSIDSMADAQQILEMVEPLQSKAVLIPNPLPGEQLEVLLDKIEVMVKLLDPIKALTSVPIIGQLAAPIVNLINMVFSVIGMLLMMVMMGARGQEMFTDSICKAVDELDWDSLKEAVDKYKKKMADMKQKAVDTFTSENEEDGVMRKVTDAGAKVLDYAGDEIKKNVEDVKTAANTIYDSVMAVDIGARAVRIAKETQLQNYSWQAMAGKVIQAASLLGVDFSLLNQPTEAQMEAFEQMFPNPTAQIKKANKMINKLNDNKKYARIPEQKTIVETEKKLITTPKTKLSDKLSPHFTLAQLCYSETAEKQGIDNTPPAHIVENLRAVAENVLEKVYDKFGKVQVNSGYRCPRLNLIITKNADSKSQHMSGEAVDFEVPGMDNYKLAIWCRDNLKYDQVILEEHKDPRDPNSGWVHVSYCKNRFRNDKLTYAYKQSQPGIIPPPYRIIA